MAPHTTPWHSCWWSDELTWLSWRSSRGLDLRSEWLLLLLESVSVSRSWIVAWATHNSATTTRPVLQSIGLRGVARTIFYVAPSLSKPTGVRAYVSRFVHHRPLHLHVSIIGQPVSAVGSLQFVFQTVEEHFLEFITFIVFLALVRYRVLFICAAMCTLEDMYCRYKS